jgi:phosphopantetheinyl transferase
MALILREHYKQLAEYAVWKIEETPEFYRAGLILSDWEQQYLDRITHPKRQLTWLASRYLLKLLLNTTSFVELLFDEHGKPYVANDTIKISISHCEGFAAAMVSRECGVGIDIETPERDISPIKRKFLSQTELDHVDNPDQYRLLMVYWGAKEVIYKIYGKRKLEFRDDMYIKPFLLQDHGDIDGMLMKNGLVADYLMHYFQNEAYILVVGVEKEVSILNQ